jgi:signal transduction histidine kinase
VTLEQLRSAPLLADLPDAMLRRLLEAAPQELLGEGEVLLREGENASSLYVVLEGELQVTKRYDTSDVLLAVCGPGELLGELSMAHGRPRSATVRAVTPARVLRIEADTLTELLAEPRVAVILLATVTRRLEEQELQLRQHDRMATLGTLTAGLLHELNNPAAAVARSVEQLDAALRSWQQVDARVLEPDLLERLADLLETATPPGSAIARLDAETELGELLADLRLPSGGSVTATLAALGVATGDLRRELVASPESCREPALRWLAGRGRLAALLSETATAAARISEVVGAVKHYSHVDEAPVQEVDVHDGLEAAWTLLRGRVPSGLRFERDYDPDLPHIEGYPGDLNTVWTNLLDNAVDAAGEHGAITVRTRARQDTVVVTVENTGPEVPAEVLERVFDPFFTTKPVGHGAGLGLATSYAVIAHRHRGQLRMTSQEGRTVVTAELPHTLDPAAPSGSADDGPGGRSAVAAGSRAS